MKCEECQATMRTVEGGEDVTIAQCDECGALIQLECIATLNTECHSGEYITGVKIEAETHPVSGDRPRNPPYSPA